MIDILWLILDSFFTARKQPISNCKCRCSKQNAQPWGRTEGLPVQFLLRPFLLFSDFTPHVSLGFRLHSNLLTVQGFVIPERHQLKQRMTVHEKSARTTDPGYPT